MPWGLYKCQAYRRILVILDMGLPDLPLIRMTHAYGQKTILQGALSIKIPKAALPLSCHGRQIFLRLARASVVLSGMLLF